MMKEKFANVDDMVALCSWMHDQSVDEKHIFDAEADLRAVSFWNYSFVPDEAIEKRLSEFICDVLSNVKGTFISNFGKELSNVSDSQEEKEEYNYNNIPAENMTVEDIQADLVRYTEKMKAEETYDGYYIGEITICNANNKAVLLICYDVVDGIVGNKKVKFNGDEKNTIDIDYTTFRIKSRSAVVFEGIKSTEEDILIDINRDEGKGESRN